jgi:hypothetical protein
MTEPQRPLTEPDAALTAALTSPLLFLIFMNALLGLLTDRGQKLRISHGLKCGVQLRRKEATPAAEQVESVGQFNLIDFVDDLSLFAQTLGGA